MNAPTPDELRRHATQTPLDRRSIVLFLHAANHIAHLERLVAQYVATIHADTDRPFARYARGEVDSIILERDSD